ncbi:phosphatidylserine decarboxylase proenzyme [Verticillium alfalfae VaMs.102]|uniref:Phosphatidylserine decarboxylase proenzyme 1, mitochondrial n=1 Tax=Verticillium alfalfae (strain VaMs.102 / ATCC MYA-4576 / FGSC 10136) TaxID=526221 RepID=C9SXE3_VERA1|nr:phosphatidylserine decarboxylase proenzyme [Verticillium alfalfae VaMs.102]EEY23333.1 phosphatidylserine decarboxylase proenzyme [Verticillium alfalfae VaMs.102]
MASLFGPVPLRTSALSKSISAPCSSCMITTRARYVAQRYSRATQPSARLYSQKSQQRPRSKITWYQLPIGVGIGFMGLMQFYKTSTREAEKQKELGEMEGGTPKKRERIRPEGPWQVRVMSTLPLKAMSRLWGRFNEIDIPYYLRVPGFKLYAWIFGVNLDEVSEPDLHTYPNLAAFFYRTLKPGARPLDPHPNALLSPSDGRILQFGQIEGGDIEQVKGMTYSIDALLGKRTPTPSIASDLSNGDIKTPLRQITENEDLVKTDEEFARVNGIPYTLPDLFSGDKDKSTRLSRPHDESIRPASPATERAVHADLALGDKPWYAYLAPEEKKTALYYAVIYLAPGDYHRFHSPANWVVERRRHFAGELFSVSPYLQRTLPGLFTLNERVVLLRRWRWGFFSYIPVGATNVGSIMINFDPRAAHQQPDDGHGGRPRRRGGAKNGEPYLGFSEATYASSSAVLGGQALRKGEEMGGFKLGSTVVLVFEAPAEKGSGKGDVLKGGWRWNVEKGQTLRMGQALGYVDEEV